MCRHCIWLYVLSLWLGLQFGGKYSFNVNRLQIRFGQRQNPQKVKDESIFNISPFCLATGTASTYQDHRVQKNPVWRLLPAGIWICSQTAHWATHQNRIFITYRIMCITVHVLDQRWWQGGRDSWSEGKSNFTMIQSVISVSDNELQRSRPAKKIMDNLPWRRRPRLWRRC